MRPTVLTGWGGTAASATRLLTAADPAAVTDLLADPPARGVIARGLGRSYGDPAVNAGGAVIDCTGLAGIQHLDLDRGVAVVRGGTSLHHLMRCLVPLGYFVPVTPGTRHVTIGGAIASDIHGKDHHRAGSFGRFVDSLVLQTADGERRVVGPDHDADLFWATVGGMGLTGIVLEATVRLLPIESSRLVVETRRVADLDSCLELMTEGDHRFRYSVAWIDCLARGRSLGRAVLTRGDFARVDQLPRRLRADPLRFSAGELLAAPPVAPSGLVNRWTVAAFNEVWYRRAPKHRAGEIQEIATFFHPLDAVAGWNRMYGARGAVQHQFVVPFGAEDVLRRIVEMHARSRVASFLGVLKRFGPGSSGFLSFPVPGWTLALDIPVGDPGLSDRLDTVDELVAGAGGRIYLAKDARMRPELFEVMYPRLDEWRKARAEVDPGGVFQSDLSRRLGL